MVHALLTAMLLSGVNHTVSPSAETQFGRVDGHTRESGSLVCEEFLGIPYAEPPVRFQPPVAWNTTFPSGVYKASALSSPCMQLSQVNPRIVGSEDCLYLNVWRPAGTSSSAQLPVMFWIHGGGFKQGASSSPDLLETNTYDGCRLAAQQDVIVVSINYRLNVFGFAAFPQKSNPSFYDANLGLQDQREGMRWVQHHIAGFRGSAESVTIFGESAGGMSVFFHLLSPRSAGLFRGAISESGEPNGYNGTNQADLTARVGEAAGCFGEDLRECLQAVDAVTLTSIAADKTADMLAPGWGITVDGIELLEPMHDIMRKGDYTAVPLLLGYNKDEANAFTYYTLPSPINTAEARDYMVTAYSSQVEISQLDRMLTFYIHEHPESDRRHAVAAIQSDLIFICGSVASSRWHSSKAPTYLYRFEAQPTCPPPVAPGSYHGIELAYVFGNSPHDMWSMGCDFDSSEQNLVHAVQTRWANFAKTLSPDGAEGFSPSWPKFVDDTKQVMVIQENELSEVALDEEQLQLCDSWPFASSLFT